MNFADANSRQKSGQEAKTKGMVYFFPKKEKHEDDEGGLEKRRVCTRHSMVDTIRGGDGPL